MQFAFSAPLKLYFRIFDKLSTVDPGSFFNPRGVPTVTCITTFGMIETGDVKSGAEKLKIKNMDLNIGILSNNNIRRPEAQW